MTPLTVTALLDSETIGLDTHPFMLDGPLAWAAAQHAHVTGTPIPPITPSHAPDMDLPLARHQTAGTWMWCTSRAALDVAAHTCAQVRRKPNTRAMALFTPDRRHHLGLGPHKARDTTLAATWIRSATWQIIATDRARLEELLILITHLGARHRNGFGHIASWTVEESHTPDGWMDRPMPHPDGTPQRVRAPYWHHEGRVPCHG